VSLIAFALFFICINATPLDDYVNMPDDSYKFELISSYEKKDLFTVYVINMTSQTWLTKEVSNHPVWYHWLLVCVPAIRNRYDKTALIYVDGGSNTQSIPNSLSGVVEIVCLNSHSITVELQQIPNEPLMMGNQTYYRTEDAIIAWTWEAFLNDTTRVYLPLQLPMTKAVVKAMDTVQNLSQVVDGFPQVENFIIAGASKRGWATWLTGAVDQRVIGMVPIVIDILNMSANINHMWEAYGFWSFAIDDYVDEGVMAYLNHPQMLDLQAIVDPIFYLDRYTNIPKYVICAAGDEFFLPDSPQFFWSLLPGQSWLRMVPNAEHSMAGHAGDLAVTIQSFLHAVSSGTYIPTFNFTINNVTGEITVTTTDKPDKARMWHAKNIHHRDFRLVVCGDLQNLSCIQPILWDYITLEPTSIVNGVYTYQYLKEAPPTGWGGFYIEMHYQLFTLERDEIKFTTEVSILPMTLPFPSCGQTC